MELLFALGAAIILIVVVWKVRKGIARTAGLLVIAAIIGYFVLTNGGFV